MKNRLNDLDSKSYMKFLKSWCIYDQNTLKDFLLFFTKQKDENGQANFIGIWGFHAAAKNDLTKGERKLVDLNSASNDKFSYCLMDLRQQQFSNEDQVLSFFNEHLVHQLKRLVAQLNKKAYLTILCSNFKESNSFFPSAWMIGKLTAQYFEMKDEKLLCCEPEKTASSHFPVVGDKTIFALNFRNTLDSLEADRSVFKLSQGYASLAIKPWFILKPPPRKEKVKLHPAKFPEVLIERFITQYSKEGENVFDPMSGTGSTQVAALSKHRNAYGCEITDHFHEMAWERLNHISNNNNFHLALDDAYNINNHSQFPKQFDYIITSPPYWDMLNMDGADTQKTRAKSGLMVNYSELDTDLGNCADYDIFLTKLLKIYNKILGRLKSGGHFTIILKNIKKKGTIYTFAWDLVEKLGSELDLANINYWLQDDIRIAPYGYGSAWVSNTFHQYCLTFKKP